MNKKYMQMNRDGESNWCIRTLISFKFISNTDLKNQVIKLLR